LDVLYREEWIKAIQSVSKKLQVLEGVDFKEDDLAEKRKKKKVVRLNFTVVPNSFKFQFLRPTESLVRL